jgi:protein-disulfide isomerase
MHEGRRQDLKQNSKKKNVTVLIIVAIVLLIAGAKMFGSLNKKPVDSVAARTIGPDTAKVKIIEFIDFQCPACAYGSKLLKEYRDKYPQDIQVQIKYYPLKSHAHAMVSALYSECAGRQGKFWQFHELLMPAQQQWSPMISPAGTFDSFAKQAGMDMGQLNVCLPSEDAAKSIEADRNLGNSLGVQSTPTYFINNKMVVGGKSLTDELNTYFPPAN